VLTWPTPADADLPALLGGLAIAAVVLFSQPLAGTPEVAQPTHSNNDQDYPAIAQSRDNVYVSYVRFAHSDRALEGRTGSAMRHRTSIYHHVPWAAAKRSCWRIPNPNEPGGGIVAAHTSGADMGGELALERKASADLHLPSGRG
jgi:hypothetical protein